MRRAFLRLGSSLLAVTLAVSMSPSTSAADPVSATALADAIRMRSEFGFDADPLLVADLLKNGPRGKFGEALTPAEEKDLARRGDLRERLEPALAVLRKSPDAYGGHYFDQTGGRLHLVVWTLDATDNPTLIRFRALAPADADIEYRISMYSKRDLLAIRDELYSGLPQDTATSAYVDYELHQVVLGVAPKFLDDALSLVGRRTDVVTLVPGSDAVPDACVSRLSCEIPWRGGTFLSGCTWGFTARPVGTSSTRWVLSAGHCSHLGDDRIHDGSIVNTAVGVDRNSYDLASPTAESMRAPLLGDAGARNLIYISSANMAYPITGKEATASQDQGDGVAMSGVTSLYVSGTIVAVDLLRTLCRAAGDCVNVVVNKASFLSRPGDSGAPVISKTLPKAFGLNFGHDQGDDRALYTPIDRVLADMQARLCLNATCS